VSRKAAQAIAPGAVLVEHGRLEHDPLTGKSGRQQVVEAMGACDVLVVVHGARAEAYVPSKVYEYLAAGRPILALTPAGTELARLLGARSHWTVDPDDAPGLTRTLADIEGAWQRGALGGGPSPFSVRAAVARLLEIADGLWAGGRSR